MGGLCLWSADEIRDCIDLFKNELTVDIVKELKHRKENMLNG